MRAITLAIVFATVMAIADGCSGFTNCYDCNRYGSGCGWDSLSGTSGTCRAGTSTGPTSGVTLGTWYYGTSSVCPCSTRSNCYDCASGTCGWDTTSVIAVCKSGSTRPSGTTSANWYYYTSMCTCSMRTSCRNCISGSGCGWDTTLSYGVCKDGSSSGPTSGTASSANWAYSSCPCSTFTSCGECIYGVGCGWSTSGTAVCMSGSSLGPTGTTTFGNNNNWYYSSCSGAWNWNGSVAAAAGLAIWLLLVVILIPLCVCICIIVCIVRAVTRKNTEVIVVQGGGMNPAYVQA